MKFRILLASFALLVALSCRKNDFEGHNFYEDPSSFEEVSSVNIGGEGAAEISTFDPKTKKLFVVTNTDPVTQIDILDLSNPESPSKIGSIDISPFGGGVNSVDVYDGKLAAAIEGYTKTAPGKVVIFETTNYTVVKEIPVGALPDMITYTPDGKYILTANEGEPNDSYTDDPVGTISIIHVKQNYAATNLDFSAFASKANDLKARGLRVFGPSNNFAKDMEPEYIAVSQDSKTAWVTLQENNAIAKIEIPSKKITDIFPLGFKDYSAPGSFIDPSDKDGYKPAEWKIFGMYLPDGIAVVEHNGVPLLYTANEGDARDYPGFSEVKRLKDLKLDPTIFPNASDLQKDALLGRLNVTTTLGDKDNDGDLDAIYSFGARSFSIWNGENGYPIFDSKNELDKITFDAGKYDDGRSDDKSVEPETVAPGFVGHTPVLFVAMERADAVAIYDLTNPIKPTFIKLLYVGDAPEGLHFVPSQDSPNGKSFLVVSNEGDGLVKIFQAN